MKQLDKEESSNLLNALYCYLPWLIIAVATFIRFFGFNEWSLSNDELSTIYRCNYESISEVISQGVLSDNHPALLEVFMFYWINLFGNSVFAVRLPFVIMGIVGCFYFYRFAKVLFNRNAAILFLNVLSISYLFILYSQIARAYILGFLTVSIFSYYWILFIKAKQIRPSYYIGFLVGGVLSFLTHYLAAFTVVVLLFAGLFLINKTNIKKYLLTSVGIGVLYLPHLPITLTHISRVKVGWLPKPEPSFFIDFVYSSLNESWLLILLILIFPILAIALKVFILKKESLLLLFTFAAVFLTTYFYSVLKGPILQFSGLIFAFPFLLLFFFSFLDSKLKNKLKYILIYLFLIISIGVYGLIVNKDFYHKKPFSSYEKVIRNSLKLKKQFTEAKIISFANTNNPDYFKYYFQHFGDSINFNITQFTISKDLAKARNIIDTSKAKYCMLSFANLPVPEEVHEFAKQKFPVTISHDRFFNSEVKLYGKSDLKRNKIFHTEALSDQNWEVDQSHLQDSIFKSAPHAFKLKEDILYAFTYRSTVGEITDSLHRWLSISAFMKSKDSANIKIVVDVSRDKKSIQWRGFETKQFYQANNWYQFIGVWERPESLQDSDQVSIYIWNPEKEVLFIDDFCLTNFADSDYNYYKY